MKPADHAHATDADACDASLEILVRTAAALRAAEPARCASRIPLELVELELARVVRIELARLLVRAHAVCLHALCAATERPVPSTPLAPPAAHEGRLQGDPSTSSARVLAIQRDVSDAIVVARACGVPVPRILLRLVAGDVTTWPTPARMARWAALLDPCGPFPAEPAAFASR